VPVLGDKASHPLNGRKVSFTLFQRRRTHANEKGSPAFYCLFSRPEVQPLGLSVPVDDPFQVRLIEGHLPVPELIQFPCVVVGAEDVVPDLRQACCSGEPYATRAND
jgi:hypothetical protein